MNDLVILWQYIKYVFEGVLDALLTLFNFLLDETDDSEEY